MSALAAAGPSEGPGADLRTWLVAATTPAPSPSATLPRNVAPDPNSVTPGLLGFLVVFALAIALWLLVRNLTGKLRRMRFREEERLAREAAEGGPGATRPDGATGEPGRGQAGRQPRPPGSARGSGPRPRPERGPDRGSGAGRRGGRRS